MLERSMPEIIQLSLSPPDDVELGAHVLSAMLRPELDARGRSSLTQAIASYLAWRQLFERQDDDAPMPPSRHLRMPHTDAEKQVRKYRRRMRNCVTAGYMSVPILRHAEQGEAAPLPPGVKRLSLNELAIHARPGSGFSDPVNLETRAWRANRAVIHLCAAWVVTLRLVQKTTDNHQRPELGALFADRSFVLMFLIHATIFEGLFAQSKVAIEPEELIRFRVAA